MKKTLILALMAAILNLSAVKPHFLSIPKAVTDRQSAEATGKWVRPLCGPNILYKNVGGDVVTNIRISGPGMTAVVHSHPTFPFSETYGSFSLTIQLDFASGATGSLTWIDNDDNNSLVACEGYASPDTGVIFGSVTCANYTLTIKHNGVCD